jgi:N-acetylmuramoyl-L-alanine amidase
MKMRRIDLIVIHCTATRQDRGLSEEELEWYHRSLGYSECGYHFYVRRDGLIVSMRALEKAGAHARGYNSHSIGIAYEGGLNSSGLPCDTRTPDQRNSLQSLVSSLLRDFPGARVVGHRDLSPDLDGDGEISSSEWTKICPCFDVKTAL